MEYNLVEMWLRKDPVRWIAGILAGLFAGGLALVFAMWVASAGHLEHWFPIKLVASIILGPSALEVGPTSGAIITGIVAFEALAAVLGLVFSHFVGTNSMSALVPMGVVWGTFSWIFLWNLYGHSFKTIFTASVPSGPVFAVCMVLGVAMSSVSMFDKAIRR